MNDTEYQVDQPTHDFMDAIQKYYGPYRGNGAARVVEIWLARQGLTPKELGKLYGKCILEITSQYRNVPDINQLYPHVDAIRAGRARQNLISDPDVLPREDGAALLSKLLSKLVEEKSLRRRQKNANNTNQAGSDQRTIDADRSTPAPGNPDQPHPLELVRDEE